MYLHNNTSDRLKTELSIEEVFQRYVGGDLRSRGDRLYARCPWHNGGNEKDPSLVLFTRKNTWHCFGCGEGGSTIDLVMKAMGINFKDAVKQMSMTYGILEPVSAQEREVLSKRFKEARQDRELEKGFKYWRDRTIYGLSVLNRSCERIFARGPKCEGFEAAANMQPYVEYLLDILSGPEETQVEFYVRLGWGWAV